jgi:hypothetical protein
MLDCEHKFFFVKIHTVGIFITTRSQLPVNGCSARLALQRVKGFVDIWLMVARSVFRDQEAERRDGSQIACLFHYFLVEVSQTDLCQEVGITDK